MKIFISSSDKLVAIKTRSPAIAEKASVCCVKKNCLLLIPCVERKRETAYVALKIFLPQQ